MRRLAWTAAVVLGALPGCGEVLGIAPLTVEDASASGVLDAAPPSAEAAPPIEASADAGTVPCPAPATFCDDFDHGSLPGWFPDESGGGTMQIDAVRARSGKSAHAHVTKGMTSWAYLYRTVPSTGRAVYARVWAYFAETPNEIMQGVWSDLPGATMGTDNCQEVDLAASGTDFAIELDEMGPVVSTSSVSLPTGEWVCLEWSVVAGSTNEATLYVNGAQAWQTSTSTGGESSACAFDGYQLGLQIDGTTDGDAFYDDLEVGPSRLGCGDAEAGAATP